MDNEEISQEVIDAQRIVAIDTELAAAELIRDGVLPSPQKYSNASLFALRITGTGTAYRMALDEHCYRPPENYLNPEFLQRCNGLPVIMDHPDGSILDSREFNERVIGSIMLPYLKGDEVWGIARIYDDASIEMMTSEQMSTSPTVVFKNISDNIEVKLDNGQSIVIEGKPALLDHLAICQQGVWDKGGKPAGVLLTNLKDTSMNEEQVAKAKADAEVANAKADAAADKMDMLLAAVDSVVKRMDSLDSAKAKADADEKDEDAKKKADSDAKLKSDEEEADKKKADSDAKAKADEEEVPKYADAQAKADSVYAAFGDSAPRSMLGEGLMAYRKRLATKLKVHSADYKDIDLNAISDSALLAVAEKRIYADAAAASRNPSTIGAGQLIEIKRADSTGRQISEFRGDFNAAFGQFKSQPRAVSLINKDHH